MKICPRCHEKYLNPVDEFCSDDGARLVLELDLEVDAMVGRNVADRFEVTGIIGAGGMGTVYKAVQSPIDRVVALKVLRQDLADDRVAVGRFRREAKAASLLSSRHTVTLYEAGEDEDGTLFLAMELLEGQSLSGRIFDKGSLPWREAVEIARQIAESLTEAHEKGIVHRDLKPENIFLIKEAATGAESCVDALCAKVLDFGIATLSRPERNVEIGLTRTGVIVGTPGYMAPEQAKGQKADARSDIYALGCLLYEMITGKPPFDSTEAVLLMGQHISADVPPFETRMPRGEVPDEVEQVVMQMLEKAREHRVQSARQLQVIMLDLLDGTHVVPPDVLARQSGIEAPRDRRKLFVATAVAVVLAAATGLGVTVGLTSLRPEDHTEPANQAAIKGEARDSSNASTLPVADRAAESVSIQVTAQPESARIFLDGDAVEGNPWSVHRPRSREEHQLTIEAEGFQRRVISLHFDSDQRLLIALERAEAAAPELAKRPLTKGGSAARRGKRPAKAAPRAAPVESQTTSPPIKSPTKHPGGINLELDPQFPTGL